MDITNISFGSTLLAIIEQISTARFVSFDFEFSGISSKSPANRSQQTLEERYSELKEAAERYTILQVGITCVEEYDATYVLRPYNFYLNPIINQDIDIERIWSNQGLAIRFLLSHGFDMGAPFTTGVEYLSRHEEKLAKLKLKEKLDKSKFTEEIVVGDALNIAFLQRVRAKITSWERSYGAGDLHINSRKVDDDKDMSPPGLTSFDRRLVHQLVHAEFPHLTTMGRGSSVVIRRLDKRREKLYKESKSAELKAKISQQTGFRWVFEALCGGSFRGIDYRMFAKNPVTGVDMFADIDEYSARVNGAGQVLAHRRPVLVGHNVFQDLVFLYSTFFDPLPDKVDEFCFRIHQLFPNIVDTKYLATHDCGDLNPSSSLGEIELELRTHLHPEIILHNDHQRYKDASPHEAGYDSYLTARIMIQLSTKLEALGQSALDNIPHADGQADKRKVWYL